MTTLEELEAKLAPANQVQLLRFWSELGEDERLDFGQQLQDLDVEEATELFNRSTKSTCDIPDLKTMKPVPPSQFESEVESDQETLEKYRILGLEAVSRGEVAVLLMAGGQGTRLGVHYPKGMYSVGLPSGKTLFQLQAERIQRVQSLAKARTGLAGKITWLIMTSGPTDLMTDSFLRKNDFFGLDPANVIQFKQGLNPCFDFNGRILLEKRNKVALAPDGNGGIYRALERNGILTEMRKRGVKYVHAHSVDNILIKVADPVFIGYCIDKNSDCGAKVVSKAYPEEPVGVVCLVNNIFQVVEYSEISAETANLRDSSGNLVYNAGNICNHFFTVAFLQKVVDEFESELKLHVAKKRIRHVNDEGVFVDPETPNGIKIEKFVFDVFQFSDRFVTWEVRRESEFSGMKNSDSAGKDCPRTARSDLLALHKIYIESAGGVATGDVEISPKLSYAGEGLLDLVKGRKFEGPLNLTEENLPENPTIFTNGLSSSSPQKLNNF